MNVQTFSTNTTPKIRLFRMASVYGADHVVLSFVHVSRDLLPSRFPLSRCYYSHLTPTWTMSVVWFHLRCRPQLSLLNMRLLNCSATSRSRHESASFPPTNWMLLSAASKNSQRNWNFRLFRGSSLTMYQTKVKLKGMSAFEWLSAAAVSILEHVVLSIWAPSTSG